MIESNGLLTFLSFASSCLFGAFCFTAAKKRGRNTLLWTMLGFFFGIFAAAVIFFLPIKKEPLQEEAKEPAAPIKAMDNESAEAFPDEGAFDVPRAPRLSGSKSLSWYYIDPSEDNSIKGPISIDELRKVIHTNGFDASLYIWTDEFEDWIQICECSNASLLLDADFIDE